MTRRLSVDGATPRFLDETRQGVIGRPLPRPEGALKVTGRAIYAGDAAEPDMAEGVLVRAPTAAGRLRDLHADAVLTMPGVLAVLRDPRFLRCPAQGASGSAPAQGPDHVVYAGQPVALVVAETFEQARHGAQALRVEIDEAPSAVDPTAAPTDPEEVDALGDFARAFADAPVRIDATYATAGHASAAMEPHAALARWDGDRLTLRGSYQMLAYNRRELADALGVAPEQVRILAPYVGGGFGGKLGIAPEAVAAAIAARELGRPVRVAMSRRQVFETTMRRTETEQRLRLGAGRDGRLTAIAHDDRVSNLPGETFAEPCGAATAFLYAAPHRHLAQRVARVNRTCAGSVRAPGEAVGMVALECAMDELAFACGLDPVELRKRNIPDRDPATGKPFSSHGLAACLDEGARRFGWASRPAEPASRREGRWWIGMGVAAAARSNLLHKSAARVTLRPDGRALVETDMTDIGTGTYAILSQIAAEALGLSSDRVDVRLGDTDLPAAAGSGGSWGAASAGSAVLIACQGLRAQLAERVGCDPAVMTLRDGAATCGDRQTQITDLIAGAEMVETGEIAPGATKADFRQASFGAHFAEVAVDAATGEVRLRRMLGVFAAGRILNERTAASQCSGGMIWGVGTALTEGLAHDPRDGAIVNRDLAEYHVPVNLDIPAIDVAFIEERDDFANPLQCKGVGELGISGAAAAVANAIFNACGVRLRDFPATPDRIFPDLPD